MPKRRDSRPTLSAVQREQRAIQQQTERGRHERFEMGYLMGLSAALLWMSEKETAPPTAMFKSIKDMLAHELRRRKRLGGPAKE